MGDRRLHLPISHSEETLFLVDQVQLYVLRPGTERLSCLDADLLLSYDRRSVRRVGHRVGLCGHSHLFHSSVPKERDDWVDHCAKVVGKHCVYEDGRWEEVALQAIACERQVWVGPVIWFTSRWLNWLFSPRTW